MSAGDDGEAEVFIYECPECDYRDERQAEGTLGDIHCPECGAMLEIAGSNRIEEDEP